jgi:thioredoxin-like negative regulator of GroEL
MIERLILAGMLIALGVIAWIAWNRLSLRRLALHTAVDPLLASAVPGVPVILYFTTPFCMPCKTQQQPALQALIQEWAGRVQVVQVDATADPAAADRWGVISAPTTFVLDAARTPRFVNRGVAPRDLLAQQVGSLTG